ncbi:hypothetical protein [Paracoccus sp. (in: a-proteobacteria)]|uniref:hypothetical protein n=1 Tax=Paracoccus sp. TaxID=267 RepID=UPI00396C78B4
MTDDHKQGSASSGRQATETVAPDNDAAEAPLRPDRETPHPGPSGGAYGSRGPVDHLGDPVTPGEAARAETAAGADVDRSAGENGAPADMDYYRASQSTGSKLALGTLAVPLIMIVLVVGAAAFFML